MAKLATMTIIKNGSQYLFLERNKFNDKVHKPGIHIPVGGKVEKGEEIENSAKREVLEETGLKLNSIKLCAIIYFRSFGDSQEDWIDYLFYSDDFEGEIIDCSEGKLFWADENKLDSLNLYEGDKIFFEYLKKYKFFVIEFLYDGFELKEHKLLSAN